jgi:peptide/nickel transport system substrate-binding protein
MKAAPDLRVSKYVLLTCMLILLLSLSLIVVAQEPKYGGTLVISLWGDPPTLVPNFNVDYLTHAPASKILGALVEHDVSGNAVPYLAESWSISQDGLTYTFNLVENATWHDGEDFTSADVKFSIEEVSKVYHPSGKTVFEQFIDSINTVDEYTLVIKLKSVNPAFMQFLGVLHAAILPKHLYEGTNILENEYNSKPIGVGPFKFHEWVKGDHVTLVKNEDYFKGGKPYLDKIIFKIIPDFSVTALAFENGEIDFWPLLMPYTEVASFAELPDVVVTNKGLESLAIMNWLAFNVRREYTGNVKVRQAIRYALDLDKLNRLMSLGINKVATGPLRSGTLWHNPDPQVKYEYNVTKANELLDAAGYPRGEDGVRFTLEFTYERGIPDHVILGELLRDSLRAVGIEITLDPLDAAAVTQKVNIDWQFDLHTIGGMTGPDQGLALFGNFFHSRNIRPGHAMNFAGYNNSEFDALADKIATEMDESRRKQYMWDAQELLLEDLPWIFLQEVEYPKAYRASFKPTLVYGPMAGREPLDVVWWEEGQLKASPPYELYAVVAVVVVAVVLTSAYLYKKRKKT